MNKFTKKLLAITLCAAMAVGTALSTSAIGVQPRYTMDEFSIWILFTGIDMEGPVMNVYTWSTTENKNGNKVTTYHEATYNDPAQMFSVMRSRKGNVPKMFSYLGYDNKTFTGYTLNCDRTSRVDDGYYCTMWIDERSNNPDSEIDIKTQNFDLHRYRVYLTQRGLFLNDSGTADGAQLKWTTSTSSIWISGN